MESVQWRLRRRKIYAVVHPNSAVRLAKFARTVIMDQVARRHARFLRAVKCVPDMARVHRRAKAASVHLVGVEKNVTNAPKITGVQNAGRALRAAMA